jgi:hypothetical protein
MYSFLEILLYLIYKQLKFIQKYIIHIIKLY